MTPFPDAQQQVEPPMRLAVLGATGSVGREFVAQALAAGHQVTALVRGQLEPGEMDDRVTLVLGNAASADDVKHAVAGSDAVVEHQLGGGEVVAGGGGEPAARAGKNERAVGLRRRLHSQFFGRLR